MTKSIAVFILVLFSMTAMADENKINRKVQLDTSVINAKLEQVLQERLKTEVAENTADRLRKLSSDSHTDLIIQTMDYFKVDTSLPE